MSLLLHKSGGIVVAPLLLADSKFIMAGLSVTALSKHFPPAVCALRHVEFDLAGGSVGCISEENGAGKSTVLRCCAGILRPTQGTIRTVDSSTIAQLGGIAYLGEADYLYAEATVAENIMLVGQLMHRAPSDIRAIAELWEIMPWWQRICATLSFGQRRRVALARAWIVGERLLCVDEPLRGLDLQGVACFTRAVTDHAARGGGVLLAAQSREQFPDIIQRHWVLRDGILNEDS